MIKHFLLTILILVCHLTSFTQQLPGKYDALHDIFIPNDNKYGMAKMYQGRFGTYSYFGKQGLVLKDGQIITQPIYDEIFFLKKSNKFAIGVTYGLKGQYSIFFKYFLIPIDSPNKVMPITMPHEFPGEALDMQRVVIQKENKNMVLDVQRGKVLVEPIDALIQIVEPYGYLVSGKPNDDNKAKPRSTLSRMMNDTIYFAYYDSNFIRRTNYHFRSIKYIARENYFHTVSKYGKGVLDSAGNEILPPYFDRSGYVWNNKNYLQAEFDGMPSIETIDEDGFPGMENCKVQLYKKNGTLLSKDTFKTFRTSDPALQLFAVTRSGNYNFIMPSSNAEVVPSSPMGYVEHPKMNILDTNGKFILKQDVDRIEGIGNGLFLLENEKLYSIFNGKTRSTIPIKGNYNFISETNGFITAYSGEKSFLIQPNGKQYGNEPYDNMERESGYAVLTKNKTVHVINTKFSTIIPSGKYSEISISERSNRTYFKVGKLISGVIKYGVIDSSGKILVPIIYDDVELDHDPRFTFFVKKNGKFGLMNNEGKMVMPILYDKFHGFNDNYGRIDLVYQGQYTFADTLGHIMSSTDGYNPSKEYWNGMKLVVNKNGRQILLNQLNQPVINSVIQKIEPILYTDLFIVKLNNKFALYTGGGFEVLKEEWDSLYYQYQFRKLIGIKGGKNYLLELNGATIASPEFDQILDVSDDGNATFQFQGKTGLMNNDGLQLIPAEYNYVSSFGNNAYQVMKNKKQVIVNIRNEVLVDSSDTYYSGTGNFIVARQNPCAIVYTSHFQKVNDYCVKNILQTTCNHIQILTDSGYCFIDSIGQKIHNGFFDEIMEYRCEDQVTIVQRKGKRYAVDIHYEPLGGQLTDNVQVYNMVNRFIISKDKLYGMMDYTGKLILPIKFQQLEMDPDKKRVKVYDKPDSFEWYDLDGKKLK